MSKEDLERRAATFRELLKIMPETAPEYEGYKKTLAGIEDELKALEEPEPLSEKVEETEPEAQAEGGELGVEDVPPAQTEELVLPKREETAPNTEEKSEVEEPAKVPQGELTLAQVSTEALARELVNRFVNFMKQ